MELAEAVTIVLNPSILTTANSKSVQSLMNCIWIKSAEFEGLAYFLDEYTCIRE